MIDYPEMKCPKCGSIIEFDDTYDSDSGEDYMVNYCAGHCVECHATFQWKEEFQIIFDGITDFEEVT